MKFYILKKITIMLFLFFYSFCHCLFSSEYKDIIDKVFSNRTLDSIEGIWIKTFANQGPAGCVTMFYKEQGQFYQVHIDECFVMGKITGKQKRITKNKYEGENAIYFYDGKVNWESSSIEISKEFGTFSIKHGSNNNSFVERWKRVWPLDFEAYNNSLKVD